MGTSHGDGGRRRVDPARRLAPRRAPGAEILLGGAADGYANIHGPNERVLLDELERTTLAIANLFGRLAAGTGASA